MNSGEENNEGDVVVERYFLVALEASVFADVGLNDTRDHRVIEKV